MGTIPKLMKSIHNLTDLSEQERFVLSFVDGKTTTNEIARVSGMGLSSVSRILEKLIAQKVIEIQHSESVHKVDEQKQTVQSIKDIYAAYENADPYSILGITKDATLDEIKEAYFEKTKMFHPDSYYAKTVRPEDKPLLVEIYKKVQHAYETLKSKAPKTSSKATPGQPLSTNPEVGDLKPTQSFHKQTSSNILENSIKQRVKKAMDYYKLGMEAFIKNDYSSAYLNFKLANSYNPYEKNYLKKMKEAESLMKVSRYEDLIKKADISIELNKPDDAINYLKSAIELTNDKKFLYYRIASIMFDFNQSLKEAKAYCQQAIALDPKNADYHILLAKIYKKGGLYKSSKVEYEQAFSLGVRTDEIKEEIKQLKTLIATNYG